MDESGPLSYSDIDDLAERRDRYDLAVKTLGVMIGDMDEAILEYAEDLELDEFEAGGVRVNISSRGSRSIDTDAMSAALGLDMAEFISAYGGLGVRNVDRALKDGWGTPAQQKAIAAAMTTSHSGSKVYTNAL